MFKQVTFYINELIMTKLAPILYMNDSNGTISFSLAPIGRYF